MITGITIHSTEGDITWEGKSFAFEDKLISALYDLTVQAETAQPTPGVPRVYDYVMSGKGRDRKRYIVACRIDILPGDLYGVFVWDNDTTEDDEILLVSSQRKVDAKRHAISAVHARLQYLTGTF